MAFTVRRLVTWLATTEGRSLVGAYTITLTLEAFGVFRLDFALGFAFLLFTAIYLADLWNWSFTRNLFGAYRPTLLQVFTVLLGIAIGASVAGLTFR